MRIVSRMRSAPLRCHPFFRDTFSVVERGIVSVMQVVYGALVGLAAGVVAGFAVAILHLAAKQWRNSRLIARGEPGYKDCVLVPLWLPGGVLGLGLGAIASAIWSELHVAAIAGAALPALFLIPATIFTILQSRRSSER